MSPQSGGAPRRIMARAPIRIADNGGWTDTWFAGHGQIFNIAVAPFVEVQITLQPGGPNGGRILVLAENYHEHFEARPGSGWPHHPLLEACIERMHNCLAADAEVEIAIHSTVPAGASTGTSAAVAVALLAALDRAGGGAMSAHALAYAAHAVETGMLGRQSGIQDQLCAAYGGLNFIEMFSYPEARVQQLALAEPLRMELDRRLALIFLGRTHDSSQVHEKVIRDLENGGPDDPRIEALRGTAARSRNAVLGGDLDALGQAMIDNTEAQAGLNPALVSADARRVIALAQAHGAAGWKVNGAGGEGGSITLLAGPSAPGKRAMLRAIEAAGAGWVSIPIHLSPDGVRAWEA